MTNQSVPFNLKNRLRDFLNRPGIKIRMLWAVTALSLVILAGCAANQAARLPAVSSDTGNKISGGKFVWIDLMTEDMQAASDFYKGLFGWQSETSKENSDYYVFLKGSKPVAGLVSVDDRNREIPESIWLVTLSVDDVDQAASIVRKGGGKVLEGPDYVEGRGQMALVSDPAEAPFILLHSSSGDPADKKPGTGEWVWTDLFTQNAKNAENFYTSLAGYEAVNVEGKKDHKYNVLKRDGRPRAGIVEFPAKGLKDNWLPWFSVDDLGKTIENAKQLGGTVLLQSDDAAVLSDPAGAAFGIQTIR